MNDERDRIDSPKRHRLAWGSALSVVVMTLCAPLAGAAGVQLPQAPQVPQVPLPVEPPSLPDPGPVLPDVPEAETPPVIPDVTTLPVPIEELENAVEPVVDVVDDVTGGAGDVVEDTGDTVGDVVDEVTDPGGPVDEVVDEVTDPDGPVGGVVDEVTDPEGPVGGIIDDVKDVTDPVVDPVVDKVDDVTEPVGETVSGVADGVIGKVDGVVDGVVGSLPDAPGVPRTDTPATDGDEGVGGGGMFGRTPTEVAALRAHFPVETFPTDGFAASVLAAPETIGETVASPAGDFSTPSLVERIARSASDIAQKIAFPLLLAFAVGAFVVLQDRMDRKDPKLALAAIDAEEDLLGFE